VRAWSKLDNDWYGDEDVQAAGESAGPVVFAVFPVLLSMAKKQNDGGRVRFTYRDFSHALCGDWEDDLNPAIQALVSADVLTCPQATDRSATVAFKSDSWRRYSEAERKAAKRDQPSGSGSA
jgi:hypothetical protein